MHIFTSPKRSWLQMGEMLKSGSYWPFWTLQGRGCAGLECFGAKHALFGRHRHHRLVSHQVMPGHLMTPKLTEEWLSVPLRLHPWGIWCSRSFINLLKMPWGYLPSGLCRVTLEQPGSPFASLFGSPENAGRSESKGLVFPILPTDSCQRLLPKLSFVEA